MDTRTDCEYPSGFSRAPLALFGKDVRPEVRLRLVGGEAQAGHAVLDEERPTVSPAFSPAFSPAVSSANDDPRLATRPCDGAIFATPMSLTSSSLAPCHSRKQRGAPLVVLSYEVRISLCTPTL